MTDQEILDKAIQKAEEGGWTQDADSPGSVDYDLDPHTMLNGDHDTYPYVNQIIFSHDFAKALWGEEYKWRTSVEESRDGTNLVPGGYEDAWHITNSEYHLQQMVIADDPIKYLGENL